MFESCRYCFLRLFALSSWPIQSSSTSLWLFVKREKSARYKIDSRDPIYVEGETMMSSDYTEKLQNHYPDAHEEIDAKPPKPLIKEIAFVDSDHAHDIVTSRSITGLLALLRRKPVFSLVKRQGAVEASTYGVEICATRTTVEELQSIRYKGSMFRCQGLTSFNGVRRQYGCNPKFHSAGKTSQEENTSRLHMTNLERLSLRAWFILSKST